MSSAVNVNLIVEVLSILKGMDRRDPLIYLLNLCNEAIMVLSIGNRQGIKDAVVFNVMC